MKKRGNIENTNVTYVRFERIVSNTKIPTVTEEANFVFPERSQTVSPKQTRPVNSARFCSLILSAMKLGHFDTTTLGVTKEANVANKRDIPSPTLSTKFMIEFLNM